MSKPFHKSLVGTLVIIVLICIGIYWLFFASLGWITGHGKELTVPVLKGKNRDEALKALEAAGFEVDLDSTYSPDQKPLVVLEQQPEGGTTVKQGRTIFLIINRVNPRNTAMPNLVNMSYRSAEMLLKSNKLLLGDTIMKPDMAQGAVLSQLLNGKEIAPGTQIPQGSKISLVIGDGLGNKQINVPDLNGMTYPEAVAILSGSNLTYSAVFDGTISDTTTAVIYLQQPEAFNEFNEPNKIQEGDNVDIRIKQNMEEGQ
ncbi:PASTA domain-containing protein [Taibaiella koreensis]|uniref:PASTA domain-containing protein n=1 Tax=Taibaiella koreensis TaxID=1268548 RepID=UPI000E59F1FF|nr:PASTA domain-containing protein [Taibaiella koreensis]